MTRWPSGASWRYASCGTRLIGPDRVAAYDAAAALRPLIPIAEAGCSDGRSEGENTGPSRPHPLPKRSPCLTHSLHGAQLP